MKNPPYWHLFGDELHAASAPIGQLPGISVPPRFQLIACALIACEMSNCPLEPLFTGTHAPTRQLDHNHLAQSTSEMLNLPIHGKAHLLNSVACLELCLEVILRRYRGMPSWVRFWLNTSGQRFNHCLFVWPCEEDNREPWRRSLARRRFDHAMRWTPPTVVCPHLN